MYIHPHSYRYPVWRALANHVTRCSMDVSWDGPTARLLTEFCWSPDTESFSAFCSWCWQLSDWGAPHLLCNLPLTSALTVMPTASKDFSRCHLDLCWLNTWASRPSQLDPKIIHPPQNIPCYFSVSPISSQPTSQAPAPFPLPSSHCRLSSSPPHHTCGICCLL